MNTEPLPGSLVTASLLSPAPLRGLLSLRFPPAQKEIFHDELAINRRQGLLADPAMDQSMREVGVSFHAHHLVARPAAGADKLSRIVLSHYAPLDNCPYRTLDAIKGLKRKPRK